MSSATWRQRTTERPLFPPQSCGSAHGIICSFKSSLLKVEHRLENPNASAYLEVEPDTGETIEMQVVYATASGGGGCACEESSYYATFRADWNQGANAWSITCTSGCDQYAGPIFLVDLCADEKCTQSVGTLNSWTYTVEVKLSAWISVCSPSRPAYLERVVYTTTSVDDGDLLAGTGFGCSAAALVTPTGQTFSVVDTGANQSPGTWVCFPSDCDGPTVLLVEYEE